MTPEIKKQAKQYKTMEEINEQIYHLLRDSHYDQDYWLWAWLDGKRDKIQGTNTVIDTRCALYLSY